MMYYNSVLLNYVSREELTSCFNALHKKIDAQKHFKESNSPKEDYLTRHEVAEMLKCDISTVDNWSNSGILKPYGLGARVYFKMSEIKAAMLPIHRLKNKKNLQK